MFFAKSGEGIDGKGVTKRSWCKERKRVRKCKKRKELSRKEERSFDSLRSLRMTILVG